jgi:hypothetical protein
MQITYESDAESVVRSVNSNSENVFISSSSPSVKHPYVGPSAKKRWFMF